MTRVLTAWYLFVSMAAAALNGQRALASSPVSTEPSIPESVLTWRDDPSTSDEEREIREFVADVIADCREHLALSQGWYVSYAHLKSLPAMRWVTSLRLEGLAQLSHLPALDGARGLVLRDLPKLKQLPPIYAAAHLELKNLPIKILPATGPSLERLLLTNLPNLQEISGEAQIRQDVPVQISLEKLPKLRSLPVGLASARLALTITAWKMPKNLPEAFSRLETVRFNGSERWSRWPCSKALQGLVTFGCWAPIFLTNIDLENADVGADKCYMGHHENGDHPVHKLVYARSSVDKFGAMQKLVSNDDVLAGYLQPIINRHDVALTGSGENYGTYLRDVIQELPDQKRHWRFIHKVSWHLAISPLRDPKFVDEKLRDAPRYLGELLAKLLQGPNVIDIRDGGRITTRCVGLGQIISGFYVSFQREKLPSYCQSMNPYSHEAKSHVGFWDRRPLFQLPESGGNYRINGRTLIFEDSSATDGMNCTCVKVRKAKERIGELSSEAAGMSYDDIAHSPLQLVGLKTVLKDDLQKTLASVEPEESATFRKLVGSELEKDRLDILVYRCSSDYHHYLPSQWHDVQQTVKLMVKETAKLAIAGFDFDSIPLFHNTDDRRATKAFQYEQARGAELFDKFKSGGSDGRIASVRRSGAHPNCNASGLRDLALKHRIWGDCVSRAEGFAKALLSARILLANHLAPQDESTWQTDEPPPTFHESTYRQEWLDAIETYLTSCVIILEQVGISQANAREFIEATIAGLCASKPEHMSAREVLALSLRAWHTREYAHYIEKGRVPDNCFPGVKEIKVAPVEKLRGWQGRFALEGDDDIGTVNGDDPVYLLVKLRYIVSYTAAMALAAQVGD